MPGDAYELDIGSGHGLSPICHQAITLINANFLSMGALGTNRIEIRIEIKAYPFAEVYSKISSAK